MVEDLPGICEVLYALNVFGNALRRRVPRDNGVQRIPVSKVLSIATAVHQTIIFH